MIHSLHVIGSMHSGGAERCYIWLLSALVDLGHPVTAVNRPGSLVSAQLDGSVPQVQVAMRNNYDIFSQWKISRILASVKPDVVLTYMSRATCLTRSAPGRGPVHVARFDGFYKVKYFRHAHAWVGVTQGLCDYAVKEGLPASRVFHIPNFVDQPVSRTEESRAGLRASLGIPQEALVVVAPGRFIRKKGFDILLSAFSRIPGTVGERPVRLLLVGDGELRGELENYASTLGIDNRISWTGWQTDPDPYYDIADVVAFPSRFEPHGNIIKEAWSHGKALVTTATHGALELVEHGSTGLVVPNDDAGSFADALLHVLRDDAARKALATAGSEKVLNEYDKNAMVGKYTELFEKLSK